MLSKNQDNLTNISATQPTHIITKITQITIDNNIVTRVRGHMTIVPMHHYQQNNFFYNEMICRLITVMLHG